MTNPELERLLILYGNAGRLTDSELTELLQLKEKIEKALEFWNCPDLNEKVKQNEQIVELLLREKKQYGYLSEKFLKKEIHPLLQSILGEKKPTDIHGVDDVC